MVINKTLDGVGPHLQKSEKKSHNQESCTKVSDDLLNVYFSIYDPLNFSKKQYFDTLHPCLFKHVPSVRLLVERRLDNIVCVSRIKIPSEGGGGC